MSISNKTTDDTSCYNISKWKDFGNFWLYDVDQKEPDWLLVRKGRPSGSNCGYLLGHNNPRFGSKEDTVLEITGRKVKVFNASQQVNMNYGNEVEPLARDWYEKTRNVKVNELGFVVPKWDYNIGVSVDGVILTKDGQETDGMIEIKGPKKMYGPLNGHIQKQKNGIYVKDDDYSHIWTTHYDQMQLGMAILGKKWCDYVVYCLPENKTFVQRIPFNYEYWNIKMYEPLKQIINNEIKPLLEGTEYPLMPPGRS